MAGIRRAVVHVSLTQSALKACKNGRSGSDTCPWLQSQPKSSSALRPHPYSLPFRPAPSSDPGPEPPTLNPTTSCTLNLAKTSAYHHHQLHTQVSPALPWPHWNLALRLSLSVLLVLDTHQPTSPPSGSCHSLTVHPHPLHSDTHSRQAGPHTWHHSGRGCLHIHPHPADMWTH